MNRCSLPCATSMSIRLRRRAATVRRRRPTTRSARRWTMCAAATASILPRAPTPSRPMRSRTCAASRSSARGRARCLPVTDRRNGLSLFSHLPAPTGSRSRRSRLRGSISGMLPRVLVLTSSVAPIRRLRMWRLPTMSSETWRLPPVLTSAQPCMLATGRLSMRGGSTCPTTRWARRPPTALWRKGSSIPAPRTLPCANR